MRKPLVMILKLFIKVESEAWCKILRMICKKEVCPFMDEDLGFWEEERPRDNRH